MKKRIMIDMDDCLTDGVFKREIEEYIGHEIDTNKTGYYLQNALEDKKDEFFRREDLDMYKNAPLKDGAYEVLKQLNEKYELYIVTAYNIPDASYQEGNHLKAKINYLKRELPFVKTEQIIFLCNKDLIDFDIRIDDSIRNLTRGATLLLFDAYNNQEYTEEYLHERNIKRVKNGQEIGDILLDSTN